MKYSQPGSHEEVDTADEQGHTGHYRIAEGGAEGDHQKPGADLGAGAKCSFVFLGEEEVNQSGDNPDGEKKIIGRFKPFTGPQGKKIGVYLQDQITRAVPHDGDPGIDADDQRHRPAGEPAVSSDETGE